MACNPTWIKDVLKRYPAEVALETLQEAGWLYTDRQSISRVTKVGAHLPAIRMIWVDMAFLQGDEQQTLLW